MKLGFGGRGINRQMEQSALLGRGEKGDNTGQESEGKQKYTYISQTQAEEGMQGAGWFGIAHQHPVNAQHPAWRLLYLKHDPHKYLSVSNPPYLLGEDTKCVTTRLLQPEGPLC